MSLSQKDPLQLSPNTSALPVCIFKQALRGNLINRTQWGPKGGACIRELREAKTWPAACLLGGWPSHGLQHYKHSSLRGNTWHREQLKGWQAEPKFNQLLLFYFTSLATFLMLSRNSLKEFSWINRQKYFRWAFRGLKRHFSQAVDEYILGADEMVKSKIKKERALIVSKIRIFVFFSLFWTCFTFFTSVGP